MRRIECGQGAHAARGRLSLHFHGRNGLAREQVGLRAGSIAHDGYRAGVRGM